MTLNRYDPQVHCPKCDHKDVSVTYCEGGKLVTYALGHCPSADLNGHLHRVCGRCSYLWYELPWDAPVAAP